MKIRNLPQRHRGRRGGEGFGWTILEADWCPHTPRCVCVNAVDKGVSERFGVKAVDEGPMALDEGGNGGWAEGSGWETKSEQKWTVAGSRRDGMLAREVGRAREGGISANVGSTPRHYLE